MSSKPIIKWVGGKTQILHKIIPYFPQDMRNYRELFVGSGSVLLALLDEIQRGNVHVSGGIFAYDINEALIYLYKNIQSDWESVYNEIQPMIEEFNQCPKSSTWVLNRSATCLQDATACRENYYYWIRSRYNEIKDKKTVECSAMFLFLNKTCFRGVYRVGPNGFNVPYGNYPNPEIVNREHLQKISELIRDVVFECCDFRVSMGHIVDGDFVYLDPPYVPENATSFVKYVEGGFNSDCHETLFANLHAIVNAKWMMSNSDVDFVNNTFCDKHIDKIICRRSIHSKNPGAKTCEVIVRNY